MRAFWWTLVVLLGACGPAGGAGTAAEHPTVPVAPGADGADGGGDPFAVQGSLAKERLPATMPGAGARRLPWAARPKGVPAPAGACRAYAQRKGAGELKCTNRATALAALAKAVQEREGPRRDALLVDVEACALPAGLVRALRAELAPVQCADALAEPLLRTPPKGLDGLVYDALYGLGLAGRLARTVADPPKLEPPYEKQRVAEFHQGPLLAWSKEQAAVIQQMSDLGVKLSFYGKAVAAVEAGMADMRFVDVVRALPVPDEYADDQDLLDAYHGNLEVALGPRKDRGRDAALVGLRGLAFVGVIDDPRVRRARRLLARMYGGRPIDALDALLLPPAAPPPPRTVPQRLARVLPTFYAGQLLEAPAALEPALLGSLAVKGMPLALRIALRKVEPSPEQRLIYGQARLALAQRYWRSVDVDEAVALLSEWPEPQKRPAEATMVLAVALALRHGPADAAAMIRLAPIESLGIGRVGALDALASAEPAGQWGSFAAFDAAVLRQVAAPPKANEAYWLELAERYRVAAERLPQPEHRAEAKERAAAAKDTAAAIRAGR